MLQRLQVGPMDLDLMEARATTRDPSRLMAMKKVAFPRAALPAVVVQEAVLPGPHGSAKPTN